jgi:hypothetical protein
LFKGGEHRTISAAVSAGGQGRIGGYLARGRALLKELLMLRLV